MDALKVLAAHQATRGDGAEDVDMLLLAGDIHFKVMNGVHRALEIGWHLQGRGISRGCGV